jgi:hypothetical protein
MTSTKALRKKWEKALTEAEAARVRWLRGTGSEQVWLNWDNAASEMGEAYYTALDAFQG